ncbi:MAG: cell division protein FtsA [Deltaproteobacteria bacterium]|nr:cell division protein FtsA [Deltaproteobacteria bacterium]
MAKREELIVGLDIGTTKIAAVVGEVGPSGIDIIGVGSHPSRGLRKGVVVNIDATVESIRRAIEEAEHMAGCEITSVYAGIAGGHIKGQNSRGMVPVKDKEVSAADIARVIEAAKAVAVPLDREIIHVLPQDYIVDEQDGIKEPLGMAGVRLEAKVHIVTAAVTSAQNIVKCCNRCNLNVADIVLEPLASALAVLHEDEKELGVALVDIGGGTTDVALFSEGSIVHSSVLPVGGTHLTTDIAAGLRTPVDEANRIKQKYGCCMTQLVSDDETLEVPSVGGRPPRVLPRKVLAEILEARVEEMFTLVRREIERTGYEDLLASGVVITGGSTLVEGMTELAEQVLGLPVRRGAARGVGGLVDVVRSPMYATGVGLVLYGAKNMDLSQFRVKERGAFRRAGQRMKSWFGEIF